LGGPQIPKGKPTISICRLLSYKTAVELIATYQDVKGWLAASITNLTSYLAGKGSLSWIATFLCD